MQIHSFSTRLTPVGQRPELFRREMQDRFAVSLAVQQASHAPLETQLRAYCGRRLRCAELRFSPHRTSEVRGGRPGSRLLLTYQMEGEALVSQGGRETSVLPGQFALIDPAQPFRIETTQIQARSVYLERQSALAASPDMQDFTGRAIDGRSGAGAILRAMIDEIFHLAPSLDEQTADSIAEVLPYTLVTALTSLRQLPAPGEPRLLQYHRRRVQRFIRQSLHDPNLDPAAIAAGVNLSLRYLYDLFAHESLPIMKWIWSERLKGAKRDLQSPGLPHRSVGEIAYSWGFANLSHFSRAFRRQYGVAPSACRRARG